jgi:hypothetical protein
MYEICTYYVQIMQLCSFYVVIINAYIISHNLFLAALDKNGFCIHKKFRKNIKAETYMFYV